MRRRKSELGRRWQAGLFTRIFRREDAGFGVDGDFRLVRGLRFIEGGEVQFVRGLRIFRENLFLRRLRKRFPGKS